jgi:hypothetical protein
MLSAKIRGLQNRIVRRYRAGLIGRTLAERKTAALLRKTAGLCAANQLGTAIELLTAENSRRPDLVLEKKIIELRRAAFDRSRTAAQTTPTTAVANRSFTIDPCGLPTIEAGELSAAAIAAALAQHGSLLIRNLVDPETAAFFVRGLDQGLAHRAASKDTETPFHAPYNPGEPRGRDFVQRTGGMLTIDSPRLLNRLIDYFRHVGLDDLFAEYLGERPALSCEKSTLRRMQLLKRASWHQDGAFLGDVRSINLWIALTPCGTDSPGLDIVAKPLDYMVESGTGDAMFPWCVGDDVAQRLAGEGGIARPQFGIGDAIIFDHTNLHRTHVAPEMTTPRHAIETWFFAPSKFPEGYTGLLL